MQQNWGARDRWLATAWAALGTRYHTQGRRVGLALDCVGLLIVAAEAAGLGVQAPADYDRKTDGVLLERYLTMHSVEIPTKAARVGDVLVMQHGQHSHHTAIAVGAAPGVAAATHMVHASGHPEVMRVVLEAIQPRRVRAVYRPLAWA